MRGAALAGAAMAVCLAACGGNGSLPTVAEKIREGGTVTVGTKWDQPGVGLKTGPGAPEGFDVDVARYIVRHLAGGEDVRITWREAPSSVREALLQNGTVDMVVASYSITMSRKPRVTFAGPYVTAYQDTMVRSGDTSIQKTSDLAGKRICLAKGSNSYRRIVDPPPDGKLDLPAILVPAANYSECVRKLLDLQLDAVSTENLSLAGYVEQDPKKLRLLNDPISREEWAVGLKEGEIATCEAVNEAITSMWRDGTAARLLQKWFGKTGLDLPAAPPPPAGCP
ncbi:glutamate ABC transporter substrate-binding protein [Nonomuraea sp. KC401]|uniref:glutamate ABC transporter substrate-binding protein n=1 Tax=unclassified Nonomuraea TaxID=2593643 RepID=UPI0010FD371D|nr:MULTISPECIES: glutamate ABC transporter substrate-binding protein [unclassified Nonomuraea]NBE92012.1 transporter substrate-binding domain-containing protein [Nonomuraea sp. K271]TLF58267.1 glutamate ABC transporter substrate-binding protein [Nonomuraea sp. KC401]